MDGRSVKAEIWKGIEGLSGYEVSNLGRVMSLNYRGTGRERLMIQSDFMGYKVVNIRGKVYKVHRLVAQSFVPNPEGYSDVSHINGDSSDNRADNLCWVYHNHWRKK